MRRWILISLVGFLFVSGCGSGDEQPAASAGSGLLMLGDMPGGTIPQKALDPTAPCNPLPALRARPGVVGRSPSFKFGRYFVQESVGSFSTERSAEDVYASLTSKKRQECIVSSSKFVGTLISASTHRSRLADGHHSISLLIGRSPTDNVRFEIVTLRKARRVAALLIVANPAPLATGVAKRTTEAAVRRLGQDLPTTSP
jgi:hypothetical protein